MRPRTRAALTFADQGANSAQNFVFLLVTAHTASPVEFGAFTVSLTVVMVSIGLLRATVSQPMMLMLADAAESARGNALAASLSLAAGLGVVEAIALAGSASLFMSGQLKDVLLVTALVLPALMIQEFLRMLSVTIGSPRTLLANDGIWIATWFLWILLAPPHSGATSMVAYGVTAGVGAVATFALLDLRLAKPRAALSVWKSRYRAPTGPLLSEYLVTNASGQVATIVVASVDGLGPTGGLRAAQGLLGPMTVVFNGLSLAVIPEVIRKGGSTNPQSKRALDMVRLVAVSVSVAVGLLVLSMPNSIGVRLLAANWPAAHAVLLPVVAARFFGAFSLRPVTVLKADLALARSAWIRVISGSLTLVSAAALAFIGVPAAAWGMAGVAALTSALYIVSARAHTSDRLRRENQVLPDETSVVRADALN